jgi:hypothetical protein
MPLIFEKMKKTTFILLTSLVYFSSFAQKKTTLKLDKIVKKDYEIIEAVITKISERSIEYTLPGDRLINSLDVSKIAVINFANGKKQTFETPVEVVKPIEIEPVVKETFQSVPIKENTIAVLPIPFVNSETQFSSEEMAKFSQNDMYNTLIQKSSNILPLTVQDLRTTNNLLRKAGIDYINIDETPIEDLQKILGVDHILTAKVTYDLKIKQSTETISSTNVSVNERNNSIKENDFSSTYTDVIKEFHFIVYFDLYKNNKKIYSQKRVPFFNDKNSWMDSMVYLLKRCPIYVKE